MKPQRAFAPVLLKKDGTVQHIDFGGIRLNAGVVRSDFEAWFDGGWANAKRCGWRIRPVLVTLAPSKTSENNNDQ